MKRSFAGALLALTLSACATAAPVMDERALAADVFQLSGGVEEVKAIVRFAPQLALSNVNGADMAERCRRELGANPNPFGRAACEMLEGALRSARVAGADMAAQTDQMFLRLESRAVEAMVETYDARELAAMRRYYASPEGRSIVAKRTEYWARVFGVGE
jgi:hypothetical protein